MEKPFTVPNPGTVLLLWDLLFGIPFSYGLIKAITWMVLYMGWEKVLKIWGMEIEFLTRIGMDIGGLKVDLGFEWERNQWEAAGFVVINLILILYWVRQLNYEAREERMKLVKEEIGWWDREIERLECLMSYWRGENENRRVGVDWDKNEEADEEADENSIEYGDYGREWRWDPSDEREIHFARELWGNELFP